MQNLLSPLETWVIFVPGGRCATRARFRQLENESCPGIHLADSRDEKKKSRVGGESCEICMYMERIPSRGYLLVYHQDGFYPVLHMGNAVGKEERERGTANTFFPASV